MECFFWTCLGLASTCPCPKLPSHSGTWPIYMYMYISVSLSLYIYAFPCVLLQDCSLETTTFYNPTEVASAARSSFRKLPYAGSLHIQMGVPKIRAQIVNSRALIMREAARRIPDFMETAQALNEKTAAPTDGLLDKQRWNVRRGKGLTSGKKHDAGT